MTGPDGAGVGRACRIDRLSLTNFRNYDVARLRPGPGAVVLTGDNGAGKTNLLEAVSLLVPGRGLRSAANADMARTGAGSPGWGVAADIQGPAGGNRVGTAWQVAASAPAGAAPSGRQVSIDGEPQRGFARLAPLLRMVWLTPAMDRLFAGPAGDRRRFFDRLVTAYDAGHGTRINSLERLVRQRNRLLEDDRPDPAWLGALEDQIAGEAVAVAAARNSALETLSRHLGEKAIPSAFPWSTLAIEGDLETGLQTRPAVQVEDEYRILLADSRARDRAAGRLLNGPHLSDLGVTHGPKQVAAGTCSTGEQKALLIGIILAHARAVARQFDGFAPVVLLDEVAAHLDRARRVALFEDLRTLGAQTWMTGTDPQLFDGIDGPATHMTVMNGIVTAQT